MIVIVVIIVIICVLLCDCYWNYDCWRVVVVTFVVFLLLDVILFSMLVADMVFKDE